MSVSGGAVGDRDWWTRVVGEPCAQSSMAATLVLAGNPRVLPNSALARKIWAEPACRAPLLRSWQLRGLDTHLDIALRRVRVLIRVWVRVVSEPAVPEDALCVWHAVDPEFADAFEVDDGDFASGMLSHVSVSIHALVALSKLDSKLNPNAKLKVNFAALSRNTLLVPSDLRDSTIEWDVCALASNIAFSPTELMRMPGASGSAFYAALSKHPGLTMRDVRARLEAPWCWYSLSARCLSRGDIDDMPVVHGALVLNPNFTDADLRSLGLERTRMCARHGFSCAPRAGPVGPVGPSGPSGGSSGSTALECGLRDAPPENWCLYVRLADGVAKALQEALDAGEEPRAMCVAALGNGNLSVPLAAWCLARLRRHGSASTCVSSLGSSRWACLTAAGNEMRADRKKHEDAQEALRACYADLVRLCFRRRMSISVCRCIYEHAASVRVSRVVRRTETYALVEFRCEVRPNRLWLPLADPLCR